MPKIELTMEEVLYLEETLRQVQGTGEPVGFKEGDDIAQVILDKLEKVWLDKLEGGRKWRLK